MYELIKKWLKPTRDENYYFGLLLLHGGIASIVWYLLHDAFEPESFLITFLISGWGFVLLWKSDNDLRFKQTKEQFMRVTAAEARIQQLESELALTQSYTTRPRKKYRRLVRKAY